MPDAVLSKTVWRWTRAWCFYLGLSFMRGRWIFVLYLFVVLVPCATDLPPVCFYLPTSGPISALQQRAQLCCTCLTEFAFQQTCGGSCVGQCVLWKRMTIIPLLFRHLDVCHLGLLGSHARASSRLGGAAILVLARQTLFWCWHILHDNIYWWHMAEYGAAK